MNSGACSEINILAFLLQKEDWEWKKDGEMKKPSVSRIWQISLTKHFQVLMYTRAQKAFIFITAILHSLPYFERASLF